MSFDINSSPQGTTTNFQVGTDTSGTAAIVPGVKVGPQDSIARAGVATGSNFTSTPTVPTNPGQPVLPTPTVDAETVVPGVMAALTNSFVPKMSLVENLMALSMKINERTSDDPKNTPSDDTPNDNTPSATITGSFGVNLQVALKAYVSSHNLSDKEQSDIENAMQNPDDPSIPAAVKQAATQIIGKATAQTKAENGLSTDWQPSQSEVNSALLSSQSPNVVDSGLVVAKEILGSIQGQLQLLTPRGANNHATMTLLQAVTSAIRNAQNTIYELQQSDAQVARSEVQAQVEMQNFQLDLQKAQQEEVAKAMKKQHTLGILQKIFGPIMKVLEIVMAAATGGILGAAFAALDSQFNVMTKAIQGIGQVVADIVNKMVPGNSPSDTKLKDALNIMGQVAVLAALMMYGNAQGALMMLGGPNELINAAQQLVTTSGESGGMISDFCDMVGLSQQDAQYIAMGITLAISITVIVASIAFQPSRAVLEGERIAQEAMKDAMKVIGPLMKVLEQTTPIIRGTEHTSEVIQKVEDLAKQVMEALLKPLKSIAESLQKSKVVNALGKYFSDVKGQVMLGKAQDTMNFVQTGLSIANDICSGLTALSQAHLAKEKGKTEAEVAELQAMIKKLQQVLNTILSNMNGFNDDLNKLSDMYKNLMQNMNQTLQQIVAIRVS